MKQLWLIAICITFIITGSAYSQSKFTSAAPGEYPTFTINEGQTIVLHGTTANAVAYQWYRNGSTWQWEAITTTRDVANGTVDTPDGGSVTVGANVDWGLYRLEVEGAGTSSSYEFYAGYYYAAAGSDTPDTLQVALDKTSYKVGETANLKLDPQ